MNANRSAFIRVDQRPKLLLLFRERADVIHHVPAFFFSHALFTGGHNPGDPFRDLPEKLTVSHCCHAFFFGEISRLAAQPWNISFVTRTGLAVTEDTVA